MRELAAQGLRVVGFEKHATPGQETSGLNSRVIHSGFHETPGSLKAELARAGSRSIVEYAEQRGIAVLKCGMLIAIPRGSIRAGLWKEAGALWNLWRQGRRYDIDFRFIFTPAGVSAVAPVRAMGGIFIPSVCVIDVERFIAHLAEDAQAAGGEFCYGNEVGKIAAAKTHFVISSDRMEVEARVLVNSAGLRAHEVSVMAGGPRYEMDFIRGDYYELDGGIDRWGIRTLIYPATPPRSRSKGVHFGPRTNGRLYIGPSATPVSEPAPKRLFVEAAQRFLPNVHESDLTWAYQGIRPKYKSDFTIQLDRVSPALVNLIGIDSPGLSSSMAIARHVSKIVQRIQ